MEHQALLENYLKQLHLGTFIHNYQTYASDAARTDLPYERYLLALGGAEVAQRDALRVERAIALAKFPVIKELSAFDFSAVPNISKQRVLELAQGGYMGSAETIILIGGPGLGKTHIATGLALTACKQGKRVRFFSANNPVNDLLSVQKESRPIRVTKLEIIKGSQSSKIGSPGALTVFIARKGSGALDDVRAAVLGDGDAAKRVLERMKVPQTRAEAGFVEMVIRAPVFADVRYGGDVLCRGMFLPEGADFAASIFPYNGGRLAGGGFSLAEHYQEDSDMVLEGLVIEIPPPLTAAERAALNKVPADQRVMNVGAGIDCQTTWWAVAGIGIATATAIGAGVTLTVTLTALAVSPPPADHLSEEELAQVDPSASARKLLAIRRELLLKQLLTS